MKSAMWISIHLASSIKPKACGNFFAFQITINGFRASKHLCFQIFAPAEIQIKV
jgi:hypothetical protein